MSGTGGAAASEKSAELQLAERSDAGMEQVRSRWLRRLLAWHWISSALALFGMLLFAITGITLNHAGQIATTPVVETVEIPVPPGLVETLVAQAEQAPAELPAVLSHWLQEQGIGLKGGQPEWSEYELYISQPRPGGDAWLSIDFESATLLYESTDRGWIAYLNDLHKGRNTGAVWNGFIDLFAVLCILFCLTGFGVLVLHARQRISVWPVTGLGILVPLLLVILLVH